MIVCAKCNSKVDSIAEMGDHIAEKAHQEYRTADGIQLPWEIRVSLMAGTHWCGYHPKDGRNFPFNVCREEFTSAYRLYEHMMRAEHFALPKSFVLGEKKRLDDFEQEWFFGKDPIRYQRPPLDPFMVRGRIVSEPDGNLIVKCPSCERRYWSGYFMDANPQEMKDNSHVWQMKCPKCGKTTDTPNQNIWLRQELYEQLIASQKKEIKRLQDLLRDR